MHAEHLAAYQTKNKVKPHFPRGLTIVDRFNASGLSIDLKKQSHLLAPIVTSVTDPNPLATPAAFTIDHFECYQAKVTKGTPKFVRVRGVPLGDRFGAMTVDVTKPVFFCSPTDVAGSDPTAPTHDEHLMCYKAKQVDAPKFAAVAGVAVNGSFGPQSLDVRKPALLCVSAGIAEARSPSAISQAPCSSRRMARWSCPAATRRTSPTCICRRASAPTRSATSAIAQQLRLAPGGDLSWLRRRRSRRTAARTGKRRSSCCPTRITTASPIPPTRSSARCPRRRESSSRTASCTTRTGRRSGA